MTWLRFLAARWRVGALALVAALVWIAHHERWTLESWRLPTAYTGDAPEILAQMRAAADGDIWPFVPKVIERLGAPFGAYWNGFPTPDKPLLLLVGALAHAIGLFAAANVAMLLAPVTAALAFYFVARWLRCRREWAWMGALLFAFTYHTFHRGLGHFSIAWTWTVPPGLLAVWLVARSRRLAWRSGGAAVCLGAALALAVSNPYNLFFWLQLMAWALIAQWFGARRRENLVIGAATMAVACAAFFASHLEVWAYVQEPEGAPLVARNYGGTEMYALKPMELVIPPPFHRWDALAFWGHRYVRWSTWRGEAYLPYLGIIGAAGLIWLGAVTVRRLLTRRPAPGAALSIGWLMLYGTVGGLTNLLALVAGLQIFRATNRLAIFISALVLFFVAMRLSRLTARWPVWGRVALALGLTAFGLLDQIPRRDSPELKAEIASRVRSDEKLAAELEAALPAGAMVFQLPVLGFPEVTPPGRLGDYELFRPYLVTRTLRFSYGAAKFRCRSRWQRDLENVPAATLVRRLEAYGFAALFINRKGYEDRAAQILKELTALGYERRLEGASGQQIVVLLRPQPQPVLPLGRAFTFGRGWFSPSDGTVRWANDDAVLSYFNPHDHPIMADIRLSVVGVNDRQISFLHEGTPVLTQQVGKTAVEFHVPQLPLGPGVNRFKLDSREDAVRLGTGRYQLRSFGLQSASIRITSERPVPD